VAQHELRSVISHNRAQGILTAFFVKLARFSAILGGFVLSALILLIVVSVAGRGLNTLMHELIAAGFLIGLARSLLEAGVGPVTGDFELVEAGVAFAIFAFLPLAQITGAHARVDVLSSRLPPAFNRTLDLAWDLLFAVVLVVIAWRLWGGMLGKMRYNETTMLLQFPVWWAYAVSLIGACVAAIVAAYVAIVRIVEIAAGRSILPSDQGAPG
tara:strand:+ start:93 stop:731 length:639 start_codon:yes stop_codon:yes gene_type:complete